MPRTMFRYYLFFILLAVPLSVFGQSDILSLQGKLRKSKATADRIQLYLSISRYFQQKQADSATHYAIEGLKLATHLHQKHEQAQMLYQLGLINLTHNNLSTAHLHFMTALDIFTRLKDKKNMILTYEELGVVEGKGGNLSKATEYLNKAIQISKASNDTADMIQSYLKLGCIEELNDNTAKALQYYQKAEKLNKSLPLGKTNMAILNHIGRVHLKEGNHAHAITHFKKGVAQTDHPSQANKHISYLTHTGDAYRKSGNDDSALAYHKDALAKAQEFSMPEEQAKVLIKIADIVKSNNSDKSLEHLQNALSIARGLSHPKLQAEVFEAMSEIYRYQERYNEALFALEQQHSLLDSLFIINKAQELASLKAKNDLIVSTEKLEVINRNRRMDITIALVIIIAVLLIALFAGRNARKTKLVNTQLAESNQVKDRLFSIIGHDLRGPIGNMTQLLSILETDDLDPEERREIFGIMKQQCDASFDVLTSLLNWGKIQIQGVAVSMEDFEPKGIADKNIGVLTNQTCEKSLQIINNIPEDTHVFADSAHFDFIIRNLLSNAIKFSFAGGTIEVNAETYGNDFVTFSVKDHGKGISPEQQKQFLKSNINVSFGTGGEKGTGLGLLLIKEFVLSNGGKIWLESEEGKGSTFFFTLKKA